MDIFTIEQMKKKSIILTKKREEGMKLKRGNLKKARGQMSGTRVEMTTKYLISGFMALLCLLACSCAISADDQRLDEKSVQKENSSLNANNDKFHKDSIYLLPYIGLLPFPKSKETPELGCLLVAKTGTLYSGNKEPLGIRINHSIMFYFENRLKDLGDIISFKLGIGNNMAAYTRATDYLQFGGVDSSGYFICKGFKRKYKMRGNPEEFLKEYMFYNSYGAAHCEEAKLAFLCSSEEDMTINKASGAAIDCVYKSDGFKVPSFSGEIYQKDIRDFWALEARVAFWWDIDISIHPVQIVDFISGLFLIDLSNDDLENTAIYRLK